jgi:hypothetical protein
MTEVEHTVIHIIGNILTTQVLVETVLVVLPKSQYHPGILRAYVTADFN